MQDPDRLHSMNYQDKIEKATAKIGAKFIDYRLETGSWVFEVSYISSIIKYHENYLKNMVVRSSIDDDYTDLYWD